MIKVLVGNPMGWTSTPELSKKCKAFVLQQWGKAGLKHVTEQPVSWVRHQANPKLKQLRRRNKRLPLLFVVGTVNRIHVQLSTEKKGTVHA